MNDSALVDKVGVLAKEGIKVKSRAGVVEVHKEQRFVRHTGQGSRQKPHSCAVHFLQNELHSKLV